MPTEYNWDSPKAALKAALELEKKVSEQIHNLGYKAEHECKDPHVSIMLRISCLSQNF